MTIPSARRRLTRLAGGCLTLLALLLLPRAAAAQSTAILEGLILADSTEAPLADAEITLPTLGRTARSDSSGFFRLDGLPPGTHLIRVRRFGYAPIDARFAFAPAERLQRDFLLTPVPVALDDVEVTGAPTPRDPRMATFERRRATGLGHFITRDVIEKRENSKLGSILQMAPGGRIIQARHGGSAWMVGGRGTVSLGGVSYVDSMSRQKGAPPGCYAAVFLDGLPVYRGLQGEILFDLNSLSPTLIQAMEVYGGGAQIPSELNATGRTCGAVVIWTR